MDKLRHIFSSILGIPEESITDALSPKNTSSWDSLNAILILTEIERGFKLKFTFDEAMAVKDFGDAVKLVRSKGGDV
jgi:acyl carrier protein